MSPCVYSEAYCLRLNKLGNVTGKAILSIENITELLGGRGALGSLPCSPDPLAGREGASCPIPKNNFTLSSVLPDSGCGFSVLADPFSIPHFQILPPSPTPLLLVRSTFLESNILHATLPLNGTLKMAAT